jgi:hypothetical protein
MANGNGGTVADHVLVGADGVELARGSGDHLFARMGEFVKTLGYAPTLRKLSPEELPVLATAAPVQAARAIIPGETVDAAAVVRIER